MILICVLNLDIEKYLSLHRMTFVIDFFAGICDENNQDKQDLLTPNYIEKSAKMAILEKLKLF